MLCAALAGYLLLRPAAPLGRPLPAVTLRWQTEGVDPGSTSVLKGRIDKNWLESLAYQPDQAPPLDSPYQCDRGDFSIGFPLGTEVVVFPQDEFVKDQVDSQAGVRLDQPLRTVKISMPFREKGETLPTYVSRIRHELEQKGAVFYPDGEPVDLPAYRFLRLAYRRTAEKVEIAHVVFVGPLGVRTLVIDLTCEPGHIELMRPYAEKIIRSFEPGWTCKKAMLLEDPEYGEFAGTGLVSAEDVAKFRSTAGGPLSGEAGSSK
jgi:hypothetical protein